MENMINSKRPAILLAEDDQAIIEVITILLQDEGFVVKSVKHYHDLKKLLKVEKIDLLLLDLWLSGEDGSEICRAIKKDQHTKHIPVIILSAHQHVLEIAKSVSADDVIQKPFDIDVLLEKVKRFVAS